MIELFHGSIHKVEKPLVKVGRGNLDFGKGFYLTDIEKQAVRWAQRLAMQELAEPILNIYSFEKEKAVSAFACLHFTAYNKEWLDFIVSSRSGKKPWAGYDIIEGGVANDRVIDTVEAYISGMMSEEMALGQLSLHQPNNQICILNQKVIDEYLFFKKYNVINSK